MSAQDGVTRPRSSIVWGTVDHCRIGPRRHEFSYPMVTLELDVDELERGGLDSILFGYERRRLLSIRVRDYLRDLAGAAGGAQPSNSGALRHKVEAEMRQQGHDEVPARITLVTMPRVCGYIFNPVSFFLCFDQHERLLACVTQVSNTFGEAHLYPLVCSPRPLPVEWRFSKGFFVSPFFDTEGEYRVIVGCEGDTLHVGVDLFKSGTQVFAAVLRGAARPLTNANILKTLMRFPLTLLLTMPRIHLQAVLLFVRARVTPFVRPTPSSLYTIRSQQNRIHRARLWLLSKMRDLRRRET